MLEDDRPSYLYCASGKNYYSRITGKKNRLKKGTWYCIRGSIYTIKDEHED
jgi:hypothetical protein